MFPNGAHDDMVDACSQALSRMIFSNGELAPKEEPAEERYVRHEASQFNNPDVLFNPYGGGGLFS